MKNGEDNYNSTLPGVLLRKGIENDVKNFFSKYEIHPQQECPHLKIKNLEVGSFFNGK